MYSLNLFSSLEGKKNNEYEFSKVIIFFLFLKIMRTISTSTKVFIDFIEVNLVEITCKITNKFKSTTIKFIF